MAVGTSPVRGGRDLENHAPAGPGRNERRLFMWHNLVASISTVAGGLLGFALQAMASHSLHPSNYGKAAAVSTLFALMTKPAAAFARLVTWHTSRERAKTGGGGDSGLLLKEMTIGLLVIGTALAELSIIVCSPLARYLHVPVGYIAVSALSVPFMFAAPPLIGRLQGEERFVPWSWLSFLVSASRFVFVALLVFRFGAMGFLVAITLASAFTFLVTLVVVWPGMRGLHGRFDWRPVKQFLVLAVASSVAVSVFLGVDVVMVEHFFSRVSGGQYSVVAVLARSIFFATGGITSVQFPKVAARHARGDSTLAIVLGSLALCVACGIVGCIGLQLAAKLILRGFAGQSYVGAAHLLGWYGLGMMLLGCAVVLVNTQQSLNKPGLLWALLALSPLEPVLIFIFHRTLFTVVLASDASCAIFLAVMAALYVRGERSVHGRTATTRADVSPESEFGGAAVVPVT
jgi:O-antigen/teichoic acid export membrane protein